MSTQEKIRGREAKFGEKMIAVEIRFWTDGIAKEQDLIKPKHAWTSGVVRVRRNESHGIIPKYPVPFNSLMELPGVIEKVLIQHGIKLHRFKKMAKYIVE